MAADNMPQTTPVIVTHFSPDAMPEMDAAMDPKNAATHIQNFLLVSFFMPPPSTVMRELSRKKIHDAH